MSFLNPPHEVLSIFKKTLKEITPDPFELAKIHEIISLITAFFGSSFFSTFPPGKAQ